MYEKQKFIINLAVADDTSSYPHILVMAVDSLGFPPYLSNEPIFLSYPSAYMIPMPFLQRK
jgi:hypothetical protein